MFKKIKQKLTPSKSDSARKSQESENKSDEQIEAKALKRSQDENKGRKESEEQKEARRKKDREAKASTRKQMIVEHNKEILERTSPVSYISFLNLL